MTRKPMIVDYSASDWLGGTVLLDPMEELAYRRLCDLIYVNGGSVPDDKQLGALTKTGRRWSRIRDRLLELDKIQLENGHLTNARCRRELAVSSRRIDNAKRAGRASAEKRKERKNNDLGSTPVQQPSNDGTNGGSNTVATRRPNQPPSTIEPRSSNTESVSRASPAGGKMTAADLGKLMVVVGDRVCELAGIREYTGNYQAIAGWLDAGCDPDLDIYPTVERIAARRTYKPPSSPNWFGTMVHEAREAREAGRSAPESGGYSGPSQTIPMSPEDRVTAMEESTLRKHLELWRGSGTWTLGPRPDQDTAHPRVKALAVEMGAI